jgi:FkbM family methyltransferase
VNKPAQLPRSLVGARLAKARACIERFAHRAAWGSDRWLPPAVAMHLIARSERRWGESELRLLPLLVSRNQLALDVGAADGVYTYFLRRHALDCHAFEANPSSASRLGRRLPGVKLHACALSDHHGELELRVPLVAGVALSGWGTVEPANRFAALPDHEIASWRVQCAPLDSFQLRDVGFIKIDVEGHELSVLQGARETLERCRPNILVEAEDRHRPGAVAEVCRFLTAFAYRGWFFDRWSLIPVERLYATDSAPTRYINNVIFLPRERSAPGAGINPRERPGEAWIAAGSRPR